MRRWTPFTVAMASVGCAAVIPVTPALRDEIANVPDALATREFRILGQFELQTAGMATIVVTNRAATLGVSAPDDSTLVVTVLGALGSGLHDTLELTFKESPAAGGSYTLRAVNATPLGAAIPVGIVTYQYVPCALNVGMACDEPMHAGTLEDQGVRLGVVK